MTSVGGMSSVGPALFDLSMVGNSFTVLDTLSWVKGGHQLKFGTAITRNQQNKALNLSAHGLLSESGRLCRNSPSSVGLLGYPRTGLRNTYYNFFVQDDIQATRKLTLNLGLRYQYETSPADANGGNRTSIPARVKLDAPGTQLMEMPKTNWGPRFGFAYSPFGSGNTVIRGAYGIYYINFNATLVQNTPTNYNPTTISLNRQQVPTLVGFPFPDISSFSGVQTISAVQRDWKTPYVQNWNFNIQQALGQRPSAAGRICCE